jgi:predicted Zn-dependent protease
MRFISTLLLFFMVLGCGTVAETGRKQINFISDDQMNALGDQAYQDLLSKSRLSKDATLTARTERIGKRVAAASGADFAWEFKLIDDKAVNAFCLPGGKIGVYTGILPIAANDAALAAVVGHEIAHAVLKHGAERMSQNVIMQLGVAVLSEAFSQNKHKDLIAAAIGLGATYGIEMPYSRLHEREADELGMKYMALAGYDPREAVELWGRMSEIQQGGGVPAILSTHPDPDDRAKLLEKDLPKYLPLYEASERQPSTRF